MSLGTVAAREIYQYIGREDFMIIDIRDKEAFTENHILGAVNIPYRELMDTYRKLSSHKTYVLYCEHGGTSLMAAREMAKNGYEVLSVIGGFLACGQHKKKVY